MMKKTKFILCLLPVMILAGCNKLSIPNPEVKQLFGSWQLVKTAGGPDGNGTAALSTENWISYDDKGYYRLYKGETQLEKSKYRFDQQPSIFGAVGFMIIYHTGSFLKHSFKVEGDTLKLQDEFHNGFDYTFVKK